MFTCDRCGECCRNLDKLPFYAELDNGNGICKFLAGDLCSIYKIRPLLCRVDESYEVFFKNAISINNYHKLNHESCTILKNKL